MSIISQYLRGVHLHCEQQFFSLGQAVRQQAWLLAGQYCRVFCSAMDSHFMDEEQLLFPAFEAVTGLRRGPTEVMRHEHEQMRALMAEMHQSLLRQDEAGFNGQADTLLLLMQQHQTREENILYAICDQQLAERARLLAGLQGHGMAGALLPE